MSSLATHPTRRLLVDKASAFLIAVNIALVVALSSLLEAARFKAFTMAEQTEVENVAEELHTILELKLVEYELRARGLTTAFQVNSRIDQDRFTKLAESFQQKDPAIINLAYLDDSIITLVYPLDDNRALIGQDLRNFKDQYETVQQIQKTGKTLIQGPIQLLQGINGFILRMPVLLADGGNASTRSQASIAVVIDAEKLLELAYSAVIGLDKSRRNFKIALASEEPGSLVIGDAIASAEEPVNRLVHLPGAGLQVSVVPQKGWGAGYQKLWIAHLGIIVFGLAVFFVMSALRLQYQGRVRARAQLMTAVDSLDDGFVLYDASDCLVLSNRRYAEIHDKCAEAIKPGARFEDILRLGIQRGQFPDAVGCEEEWLAVQLEKPGPAGRDFDIHFDNGRWLRIIDKATPDGGRVGLRKDITNQIESRDRAESAERRLIDAINALPAGFWLFDSDGKLALFNDYYCKLYEKSAPAIKVGATANEILRYGLSRGEYPEAIGREEEWLQDLSDKIAAGEYEWEYPLQNGRWVRSYNQPISDGGRVGIRVDITELKKQQADLEETNTQLRSVLIGRAAAEKRFFDVAKISNDWFWEQDKNLIFTYISEGYDNVMSGNSALLLGKTWAEAYADDPDILKSADWKWLEAKYTARVPFKGFVYRAGGTSDNSTWIRISGIPVFGESGEFAGYRGVGSDISHLYNALRRAETANIAKTEFLNTMSHELRTPLTVVLGFNAFLAKPELMSSVKSTQAQIDKGGITTDDAARHLEAIKREVARFAEKMDTSGNHLLALIDEMLDLAMIDAGSMKIETQEIELHDVIESIKEQFLHVSDQKSVELIYDKSGDTVIADELRLRQILINLVGNALKFTDSGYVRISTEARSSEVAIHVEDSGCGIPDEKQQTIFERFSQIDPSETRKRGGTGLGLAISRDLVELQGGELMMSSTEGAGSKFTFTLPIAKSDVLPRTCKIA